MKSPSSLSSRFPSLSPQTGVFIIYASKLLHVDLITYFVWMVSYSVDYFASLLSNIKLLRFIYIEAHS
jgi:hypothetical protein